MDIIFEKIVRSGEIVVSPRPVWKCRSCQMYGKRISCPPYVANWRETLDWVRSYKRALLLKFKVDMSRFEEEKRLVFEYLLDRENMLFRKYPFVFALFPGSCNLCSDCPVEKGGDCLKPEKVRPSVDALGIEITSLVDLNFEEEALYSLIFLD